MKKLRLEIEEIQVESFEVAEDEPGRGTVRGNQPTFGDTCSCECTGIDECTPVEPCSGYPYSCNETFCWGTQCIIYC